jgi:nicotinate (nicotinamide) nucleotide adenylyltransferase/ribosome silencing factor RsfS/YbeB/iojap
VTPGRFGDERRRRIGLLGGSFNPAHAGHRHVAEVARRALKLDEVWLLVSPGNPLKPVAGMAPLAERLASARRIADGRRIIATDLERTLGTRFTADTLAALRRRFRCSRFVFVIGADNLVQLPRWKRWRDIAQHVGLAVLPRPAWTRRAVTSRAAQVLRRHRRSPGALLAESFAPHAAWCLVPAREHAASATAIRQARSEAGHGREEGAIARTPKTTETKPAGKAKAEVEPKKKASAKVKAEAEPKVKAKAKAEAPSKKAAKTEVKTTPKAEPKAKAATTKAKAEPKAKAPPKAKADAKPKAKATTSRAKTEAESKTRAASKTTAKTKASKAADDGAAPAAPRPKRSGKREKLSPDRLTLIVEAAMKSLEDDKAENIVLLDVTGRADYADRLIVATGQVERQLQAMAQHLDEAFAKVGLHLRRDSVQASPDWVLIDAGDLVIHLFRPDARELYRIERMWGPESPGASNATPG